MTTSSTDKGWAKIGTAHKFHYYRSNGRSACGKYLVIGGSAEAFQSDDGQQTSDDCAACRKKVYA